MLRTMRAKNQPRPVFILEWRAEKREKHSRLAKETKFPGSLYLVHAAQEIANTVNELD